MQLSRTSPNIIKISTKRCHCPTPANSLANKLLSIYSLAYLAPYSRALVWDCDSVSWAFSVPPRDEAKEDNNGILCVTYFTQARWQARDDSLHPPQRRVICRRDNNDGAPPGKIGTCQLGPDTKVTCETVSLKSGVQWRLGHDPSERHDGCVTSVSECNYTSQTASRMYSQPSRKSDSKLSAAFDAKI
ncbi:hypothetical protein An16g07760 [Aspergillus niger]|uniref:Uncharacterized protein n=2 Tax=Aspergillus niger TaxID=5061 RepID=A2R8N3_ASPNC|nr:hypothetical protein An16g07760 [Aspergillus niger]CAK47026.1 hypothetical protein An16g07760 [Aspergillus niger]